MCCCAVVGVLLFVRLCVFVVAGSLVCLAGNYNVVLCFNVVLVVCLSSCVVVLCVSFVCVCCWFGCCRFVSCAEVLDVCHMFLVLFVLLWGGVLR